MKSKHSLVLLLSACAAMFSMSSAVWAGDACQEAVNKAASELHNKGGLCRTLVTKYKTAAAGAHAVCSGVRDKIRMCWANYRKAKTTCDKIANYNTRRICVEAAKKARGSCIDMVKNSADHAMCKDKQKYAAKCGAAAFGSCGAVVYVAAGTCVIYWAGVLIGAILGK